MEDFLGPDVIRAIRTALRSLEAAQEDVSPELAVEHLTGAVYQLTFVVGSLAYELAKVRGTSTEKWQLASGEWPLRINSAFVTLPKNKTADRVGRKAAKHSPTTRSTA